MVLLLIIPYPHMIQSTALGLQAFDATATQEGLGRLGDDRGMAGQHPGCQEQVCDYVSEQVLPHALNGEHI